jgi:hypothetical protein
MALNIVEDVVNKLDRAIAVIAAFAPEEDIYAYDEYSPEELCALVLQECGGNNAKLARYKHYVRDWFDDDNESRVVAVRNLVI